MPSTDRREDAWNERLVQALQARHQQAWQQKKQSQHQWKDGANIIEAVRKDIRITKTGKIFNLDPSKLKLSKRVYEECVRIILSEAPILPPGFAPLTDQERATLEESSLPYVDQMSKGSGGYAILLAFHFSGRDNLTKDEICRQAQPYCDSEMEANFHSGRMYGAWKSNDTLVRHDFLTCHKAGAQYVAGLGFRSKGKNLYSITPTGKRAIQQMLRKWPDITRQTPILAGPNDGSDASPSIATTAGSPFQRSTPARSSTPKKKSAKSGEDEAALTEWIESASVGAQKVFKVGKDRRRYLHNLCDKLQEENVGLRLRHESEEGKGAGRRDLFVTILDKPYGSVASLPTDSTPTITATTPPRKRAADGPKLGGTAKKPRSAGKAAAEAALARLEQRSSFTAIKVEDSRKPKKAKSETKATIQPDPQPAVVELLNDDDVEDRKPAAKPMPKFNNPHDYCIDDVIEKRSDGSRCLVTRVHCTGHVTIINQVGVEEKLSVQEVQPTAEAIAEHRRHKGAQQVPVPTEATVAAVKSDPAAVARRTPSAATDQEPTSTSARVKPEPVPVAKGTPTAERFKSDRDVIDLCDEEVVQSATRTTSPEGSSSLVVLIDDRERSRNHQPRMLRTELTKEFKCGSLERLCPQDRDPVRVEERKLHYGDFAFIEELDGVETGRLSVAIERKRVADLIQRSTYGDHWKQLSKMRDHCQHAIMLLENDTRVASRFDAYGSQSMEPKVSHHTIENEADLFRFIGRAILSSKHIKFAQTLDARGTFRTVGAIGLVAQACTGIRRDAQEKPPNSTTQQNKLADHLTSGGVHWKLAKEIAFQFGSIQALRSAFDSCSCDGARRRLVLPILQSMGEMADCPGDKKRWSEAVFAVFSSSRDMRIQRKSSYDDIKAMVGDNLCDPGVLLLNIYIEATPDAALSATLDSPPDPDAPRVVSIEISNALGASFDKPTGSSFYTLQFADDNPWSLPFCRFSTTSGGLHSSDLTVYLMEGTQVVEAVAEAIGDVQGSGFIGAARDLAAKWNKEYIRRGTTSAELTSRQVLLVRGLAPALEKASKAASYNNHTKVACELVFAALMMEHDVVVLQAIRKKQEDTTMILRQVALACYHFQLLHHERPE